MFAAATATTPPTAPTPPAHAPRKLIAVEQFTLANGMKVIFHVDRARKQIHFYAGGVDVQIKNS
ncbi:MAG: hypothetical protein WED32_03545 [Patescibacteria group bacterium]